MYFKVDAVMYSKDDMAQNPVIAIVRTCAIAVLW